MIILRQKEFARKDYKGLNKVQKLELRERRNELAKELMKRRKEHNKELLELDKKDSENSKQNLEILSNYRKKLWGEDSEIYKKKMKEFEEEQRKRASDYKRSNMECRNSLHDFSSKQAQREADSIREEIKNQSFIRKFKNYNKALWNGDVGLSKGANRAIMISAPTTLAAGIGLAAYRHKKKKNERKNKNDNTKTK